MKKFQINKIASNIYFITAGIISFLDEPEDELKVWALERLNQIVGDFWPEISDSVEKM